MNEGGEGGKIILEDSQTSVQLQEAPAAQEEDTDDHRLEESCSLGKPAGFGRPIVPR